jgi:D-alanyl-D-alanine carboxypeptidase (penicillin-binding protein 5/6)
MDLKKGESISVEDLLTALLVKSANDAAVALAEQVGGSVDKFAALMNSRAKELGAKETNFRNPH